MKLKLTDADRERLGAPEWLDVSIDVLPVREAEAIEDATGLAYADALDLFAPLQKRVDETTLRIAYKPKGIRLLVWLGLHRAGIDVAFDELDFDYRQFAGWRLVEEPGKDEGSPSDEPPTPSTSPSTGRTRSKRSQTST